MGHVCTHDEYPGPGGNNEGNNEHPVIAVLAIIAIVAAILLIAWARLELHGTEEIEAAFTETPVQSDLPLAPRTQKPAEEREVEDAVTSGRFATGFSP